MHIAEYIVGPTTILTSGVKSYYNSFRAQTPFENMKLERNFFQTFASWQLGVKDPLTPSVSLAQDQETYYRLMCIPTGISII